MENNKPICLTFAGVIGSSKTPIANFLSCKLGLPVFNNDAVGSSVIEDLGFLDKKVQEEKRNDILKDVLKTKRSFICDASIDRGWSVLKQQLLEFGYDWFVISLGLSKEKLIELYRVKKYDESLLRLDQFFADHDKFIAENKKDINISINDSDFSRRLEISYSAVFPLFNK